MTILITNHYGRLGIGLKKINLFIKRCLQVLHLEKAEVSLLITTNHEIQQLNQTYRQENKPTDILSFGMREHCQIEDPLPPDPEILGDLVISIDTIKEQARQFQRSYQDELFFILAHGLLHLIGYDHATELDQLRMTSQHRVLINICARSLA